MLWRSRCIDFHPICAIKRVNMFFIKQHKACNTCWNMILGNKCQYIDSYRKEFTIGTGGESGGSINHKPNANICEIITRQSISGVKAEVNTKSVNTSVSHAVAPFVRVVVHGLVGFLDDFVLDWTRQTKRRKFIRKLRWTFPCRQPASTGAHGM